MSFLLYLFKVSIAVALFFMAYRLVFRRFTFFRFNRFFLLGSLVISLFLPLVNFPAGTAPHVLAGYSLGIDWEGFVPFGATPVPGSGDASLPARSLSLFPLVYLSLSAAWLLYRVVRYYSNLNVFRGGTDSFEDGVRLVLHPEVRAPFALFSTVYLASQPESEADRSVIRHEMVHARQLHSADLLLAELMIAFLWFNPFVYLFRRHMRENHEFLADRGALLSCSHPAEYLQTLSAELSRRHDPALASYFRSSTIKKRIIMITHTGSHQRKRWYYLALAPLLILLFMAFQQPVEEALTDTHASLSIQDGPSVRPVPDGNTVPSRFPLDAQYRNAITAPYGKDFKNPFTDKVMTHKGLDIAAPTGTPVYATADGEVVKAGETEGYGRVVALQHDEGFVTLFAHLDDYSVETGDRVKKDDQIGTVGNTGLSTGPHLHYEVRKNGEHVDPADYY